MKVIAIANQKGGTAKTTTTAVLGVLLSRKGHRVHLLDMDPQASLSRTFLRTDGSDRLFQSLKNRAGLPIDQLDGRLSLTPSTVELSRAETDLLAEPGREYFLRLALERTELPDDAIVLIDCPPSLGVLALNCLVAAGGLVVTVQPGGFELHALVHLHMTVAAVQQRVNPELTVFGTIITNSHPRRSITGRVREELARVHNVLGSVRTDARLLYATTAGTLLNLRRSNALDDYGQVVDKLMDLLT
jgi:chromosome partitioning protein